MKFIINIPDDGKCQYEYDQDSKRLIFPCPELCYKPHIGVSLEISDVIPYDREIRIGDEIQQKRDYNQYAVVTYIDDDGFGSFINMDTGVTGSSLQINNHWVKTGRHFPEVVKLVNLLKEKSK